MEVAALIDTGLVAEMLLGDHDGTDMDSAKVPSGGVAHNDLAKERLSDVDMDSEMGPANRGRRGLVMGLENDVDIVEEVLAKLHDMMDEARAILL